MKKEYILTFSISALVIATIFVILMMLMLPQQVQLLSGNINEYDSISKSKYTFESTKDVSNETLKRQYSVTSEDMNKFSNTRQYQAGNSDPFSAAASSDTSGNSNSSSDSSSNSTGSSNSAGTISEQTQQKITNSNNGVANPSTSGK